MCVIRAGMEGRQEYKFNSMFITQYVHRPGKEMQQSLPSRTLSLWEGDTICLKSNQRTQSMKQNTELVVRKHQLIDQMIQNVLPASPHPTTSPSSSTPNPHLNSPDLLFNPLCLCMCYSLGLKHSTLSGFGSLLSILLQYLGHMKPSLIPQTKSL